MRGDERVLEYLNKGLRSELTAVNKYSLHFRICLSFGTRAGTMRSGASV
jgi:bacterioferritin